MTTRGKDVGEQKENEIFKTISVRLSVVLSSSGHFRAAGRCVLMGVFGVAPLDGQCLLVER